MAANSSINLLPLDVLTYKNSLITYLQTQDIFKDYNFEASNWNVLLDILSYNSFFMAFYGNMIGAEMFLDSAQLHDSVVSHAKELNYLPRSNKSSVGDLTIVIDTGNANVTSAVIQQYTSFNGRIGSNSYTFSTNGIITGLSTNSTITFANVQVYEGELVTDTYLVDYSNTAQRFIISNANVDISGLTVLISEDNGASNLEYQLAPSLFGLAANSYVYFLQGCENNQYEIVFGDNVTGRRPKDNSIVYATYRDSDGSLSNLIGTLIPNGLVGGYSNVTVTLNGPTTDGAFAESIASIKFNAPRAFNAQERGVSAPDYETLLQAEFPEIISISAYGGETTTPPQYGTVFISVVINGINGLPQGKVTEYTNWINSRSTLTVSTQFVAPTFLYVACNTNIKYDIGITAASPGTISSEVANAIALFSNTNLNDFKSTLYYSQLVGAISNADVSIVSNETELLLVNYITPVGGNTQNFTLSFYQPLVSTNAPLGSSYPVDTKTTITSTVFLSGGQQALIEDDGQGNLRLVSIPTSSANQQHSVINNIGTVNYNAGAVQINNLLTDTGFTIKLYAATAQQDLQSNNNVVLSILPADVTISVEQIST
jgi:hypothetical protein